MKIEEIIGNKEMMGLGRTWIKEQRLIIINLWESISILGGTFFSTIENISIGRYISIRDFYPRSFRLQILRIIFFSVSEVNACLHFLCIFLVIYKWHHDPT